MHPESSYGRYNQLFLYAPLLGQNSSINEIYNIVSKNRWLQLNTQFKYLKNVSYKIYGEMKTMK